MAFDYAGKVRALLANAEDESLTDEARQSYRNMAFRIMRDYAIAEENAIATDQFAAVPMHTTVTFAMARGDLVGYYHDMIRTISRHTGVRVRIVRIDLRFTEVTIVGYEGDVRYTEFLWTSAFLMFVTKIDPVWDTNAPEAVNIYRMRAAGLKRAEIADMAWGANAGLEAKNRSKVQRIYLREAVNHAEDAAASGLDFNSKLYRKAYADQFVRTLGRRLGAARDAADSMGGGLVMANRAGRVDDAFYDLFPTMRPSTEVSEPWVSPHLSCAKCKAAKSGYCREHNYLKPRAWTRADEARWDREQHSSSARAGRTSGQAAAEGVVVRGTAARTDRIDRGSNAIES